MGWIVPYTIVGGTALLASWANTNVRDNSLYLFGQANHQGQFIFGSTITATLTPPAVHNFNPPGLATANIMVATTTALCEVTGLLAQPQGTMLWMINGSGAPVRLKHNDARSLTNNRLTISTGGDYDLQQLGIAAFLFIYGQWRVKV